MENDFQIKEINKKERESSQNEGNLCEIHKETNMLVQQEQS